jgi:hypothetical protein
MEEAIACAGLQCQRERERERERDYAYHILNI